MFCLKYDILWENDLQKHMGLVLFTFAKDVLNHTEISFITIL